MQKQDTVLLDVFLVTYNRARFLRDCIKSILDQTYKYFNLIVLDNCSVDNTKEVVMSFRDSRIKYICHEENIGSIENINFAIKNASSQYFMIFHDDDIMCPNMIEREIEILKQNPGLGLVSCKSNYIDENGIVISNLICDTGLRMYGKKEFFEAYIKSHLYILFPSIMYRTSLMKQYGLLLDRNVGPSADVYMIFEYERCGGYIGILEECLMYSRQHSNQDSAVNRVSMIFQLFSMLKQSEYYHDLLLKNKRGQKKHFRWLMHVEICGIQNGMTDSVSAKQAYKEYKTILECSLFDSVLYRLLIFDTEHINISKFGYKIIKLIKAR